MKWFSAIPHWDDLCVLGKFRCKPDHRNKNDHRGKHIPVEQYEIEIILKNDC